MRVLFINSVCGIGSTGRICTDLAKKLESEGHEVKIAYGRGEAPEQFREYAVRIGTEFSWKLHALQTRLFDTNGFGSSNATKKFLQWAETYKPNVLWLHNIHGYYINVEMLFSWIKKHPEMEVKWTLHDCWAFTGHCAYFTAAKCEQWKTECRECGQKDRYPQCLFFSNVKKNYQRKKAAFAGVHNLTLITPSQWLANLTRESFLKDYPVEVHYNTIDKTVFKPTPSDFRQRYGLEDKFIVLGVANIWDERKGLKDFYKLAQMLDEHYAIVLVGLSKKQISELPKKIKGLKRTNSTEELAAIYSAAGLYVNPSKEETFGMTTAEAEACGTSTVVYKDTACEGVAYLNRSVVVEQNVEAIYKAITGKVFGGEMIFKCYKLVCIPRTASAGELAEIYTAADVFVNPTYEDNYPTVNLEAIACGTRLVTYDTGGCRETIRAKE